MNRIACDLAGVILKKNNLEGLTTATNVRELQEKDMPVKKSKLTKNYKDAGSTFDCLIIWLRTFYVFY